MTAGSATHNVKQQFADAAQLAGKQAARIKVSTITLPSACRALGRQLYEKGTGRQEHQKTYADIDGLIAQSATLKGQAAERPATESLGARARAAASSVKNAGEQKGIELRLAQAFGLLGEAASGSPDVLSDSPELVRPVTEARTLIATLDADIASLSAKRSGTFLSPKQIVVGAVSAVCVLAVLVAGKFMFGGLHSAPVLAGVATPPTSARTDTLSTGGAPQPAATPPVPELLQAQPSPIRQIPAPQGHWETIIQPLRGARITKMEHGYFYIQKFCCVCGFNDSGTTNVSVMQAGTVYSSHFYCPRCKQQRPVDIKFTERWVD